MPRCAVPIVACGGLSLRIPKYILLLTIVAWTGVQAAEFRFNPPDSIAFHSRLESERWRVVDGLKGAVTIDIAEMALTLERSNVGYTLKRRVHALNSLRPTDKFDSLAQDALEAVSWILYLDSTGMAVSASGQKEFWSRVLSNYAPMPANSVLKKEDWSAIDDHDVGYWNSTMGRLLSLSLDMGTWFFHRDFGKWSAGQGLDLFTAFRLIDTTRVAGRLTLHVLIESCTDPVTLAETTGLEVATIIDRLQLSEGLVNALADEMAGGHYHVELEVDAETLLPLRERHHTRVFMRHEWLRLGVPNMESFHKSTTDYTYNIWPN